jgi:sulfotransferase
MRPLHFISGLPRSGSTLLSALLKQNPRFHASMSGPVAGLVTSALREMSAANEYSIFISDEQRKRILRGIVDNYYGPEFGDNVIFDTNRGWCAQMSLIDTLFPQSRVIACVRDVQWIVDSVERLIRRNALSPSSIFKYQSGGTVYSRADLIANGEGMVGYSYNALKEAFYSEHAKRLMLVQYETLVTDPQRVLSAIYQFVGEAEFTHDFEHVEFEAEEFDNRAGTPGLHVVRAKVSAEPRQTVLPPDVFQRFANDAFWRNPELNTFGVPIV